MLEFEEFMKIKGCKTATKHLFNGIKVKSEKQSDIKCRYDWFQSQSSVTISFYAKRVNPESLKKDFKPNKVKRFQHELFSMI